MCDLKIMVLDIGHILHSVIILKLLALRMNSTRYDKILALLSRQLRAIKVLLLMIIS